MKFYYLFYCSAYAWYNTAKNKSKDTLRLSALVLISLIPTLNLLSILFLVGLLKKHTPMNGWVAVAFYCFLFIFNILFLSSKKSELMNEKFAKYSDSSKKRVSFYSYLYLVISVVLLVGIMLYNAYIKNKYGNYDSGR